MMLRQIIADDVGFKIEGNVVSLKGIKKVESDFEAKEFTTSYNHCIETPDIVLKKYMEMKEK